MMALMVCVVCNAFCCTLLTTAPTGSVYKYNITSGTWTDITPVSGSNLYFGFGGLAIDVQTPGTIMVAALNSWWPDGQIFRSNDR